MIFDVLSNAAYRVSLRGPGVKFKLEGMFTPFPRPGEFGAEQRPGAG